MKAHTSVSLGPRGSPYDVPDEAPAPVGRRSSHVSRACATCRRRKTKCNGVEPMCGTCAAHGTECVYSAEPDRRKTKDANAAIASLKDKVEDLERQLEDLATRFTAMLSTRHQWPLTCSMRAAAGDMKYEDGEIAFCVVPGRKPSEIVGKRVVLLLEDEGSDNRCEGDRMVSE